MANKCVDTFKLGEGDSICCFNFKPPMMQLRDLDDSKETIYGALDAWVAWEQNFPIGSLRNILISLEKEQQWHRVIQVSPLVLPFFFFFLSSDALHHHPCQNQARVITKMNKREETVGM